MKLSAKIHLIAGILGAIAIVGFQAHSIAQGRLTIGGQRANFGSHQLRGGFTPDPKVIHVVSGGNLDTSTMNLGNGCRGWATAQPDVIVRYNGRSPTGILRFYVRPDNAGADTTLLVNDAGGNWYCNDDSAGLNPMVTVNNPRAGQYDVWIGSYRSGEQLAGNLHITELSSNTP